jgi:hypothetical protein
MWGGVIAALLEIVIIYAVVDDWGHAIGHPMMTDDLFMVGFILSTPALFLESILGVGGFPIYLTAFLSIFLCALAFAIIASVRILRRQF